MSDAKRLMYMDLDERLRTVMREFWKQYGDLSKGVSSSGSVLFGEWHVHREGFDGLKFKLTEKMMDELISNKEVTVKMSDHIEQKEPEELE